MLLWLGLEAAILDSENQLRLNSIEAEKWRNYRVSNAFTAKIKIKNFFLKLNNF